MCKKTVIVIDDEEILRRTFQIFLEDEGFTVEVASNGSDALSIIKDKSIDIAIVDINLPDMDGESIVMRSWEINPAIKFIIHTGDTNYTVPPLLAKAGLTMNNILFKPVINFTRVIDLIHQIAS